MPEIPEGDPELKKEAITLLVSTTNSEIPYDIIDMSKRLERFSTWRGLKRSVACIIRYASQLRKLVERRENGERNDLSTSQQAKPIPPKY